MPWGIAASVAGAVVSSAMAPSPSDQQAASGQADPFAGQRPQYQTALQQLMTGGASAMAADPSYQWRLQQGSENLSRQMASQGLTASGAELAALQDYGQNQASTEFQNQYSRLAQLAGANVGSPAAAAQITANQQAQQQQGASAFGNMVGGAISNWGSSYSPSVSGGSAGFSPTYGSGAGGYDMSFGGSTSGFF